MIVIDANELLRIPRPQHRLWHLLCALAKESGHAISTADVTFEEFQAGYARNVREAWEKLCNAELAFREFERTCGQYLNDPGEARADSAISEGISGFRNSLTILPTGAEVHAEALRREVWRKRPASVSENKPGSGARDVVLWLAAVQHCKTSNEPLFFVSDDVPAFGKNSLHAELIAELADELGDRASEFRYCRNIAELLQQIADTSDEPEDFLPYGVIESDELIHERVKERCGTYALTLQNRLAEPYLVGGSAYFMNTSQRVTLAAAGETSSYRIGGKVWLIAKMRWDLHVQVENLRMSTYEDSGDVSARGLSNFTERTWTERPVPGVSTLSGTQGFAVTAVIGVAHDADRSPEVRSVDVVSVRLLSEAA